MGGTRKVTTHGAALAPGLQQRCAAVVAAAARRAGGARGCTHAFVCLAAPCNRSSMVCCPHGMPTLHRSAPLRCSPRRGPSARSRTPPGRHPRSWRESACAAPAPHPPPHKTPPLTRTKELDSLLGRAASHCQRLGCKATPWAAATERAGAGQRRGPASLAFIRQRLLPLPPPPQPHRAAAPAVQAGAERAAERGGAQRPHAQQAGEQRAADHGRGGCVWGGGWGWCVCGVGGVGGGGGGWGGGQLTGV